MVILNTFLGLSALGFVLWLIGYWFEFTELTALGAIMVVAAGAMVSLGGLEVQSGETIEKDYQNESGTWVNNQTQVTYEYRPVDEPRQIQLGGLTMLAGGLLFSRGLTQAADLN